MKTKRFDFNFKPLQLNITISVDGSVPDKQNYNADADEYTPDYTVTPLILQPLEVAEINGIAAIYGIRKGDQVKLLKNTIVEVGTISTAAKAAISALKAIPGIGLATGVINAVIAGGIVAALGEGSIYVFEQIYLGNKDISDVDWVRKIMESKLSGSFVDKLKGVLESLTDNTDRKEITQQIFDLFIQDSRKQ